MRLVVSCVAVFLISAAVAGGRAQSASQQPTRTPVFRSRIDIARLDVTVIDNKTGKPVNNLTERDFTVTENGVRQAIGNFSPERLEPMSPAEVGPVAVVRGTEVAPRSRRIFLIVLGESGDLGGIQRGPVKPYEGVEYLRPLDGEKHLICLTDGMYLPLRIQNLPPGLFLQSSEDDARLAARANDGSMRRLPTAGGSTTPHRPTAHG